MPAEVSQVKGRQNGSIVFCSYGCRFSQPYVLYGVVKFVWHPVRAALNHAGFSAINHVGFMANPALSIDMYYVYVLLSLKDNKFYIGFSEDVKKRLADYNAGRNMSTKPRRPFELIYY